LTESCLYNFDTVDDLDVNKLFGFSSTWNHKKQSARIGWRCIDGETFEIVTYSHENGKIDFEDIKVLGTVLPNQEFICSITEPPYYRGDPNAYYAFTFRTPESNEIVLTKNMKSKSWFPFQYYLWPYFGGNRLAPQDMIIELKIN
jgi:hypothetical protein